MSDRLQKAKSVDLVSYLSDNGFHPVKAREGAKNWYYNSPFRSENTPSFYVDRRRNRWGDWGENKGTCGDVIDFVSMYEHCTTREAIDKILGKENLTFKERIDEPIVSVPPIEIVKIKDKLTSEYLVEYIEDRAVPLDLATLYLKEIDFRFEVSRYYTRYGIAFENDLGGYEIRTPYWKGGTSPKGITTIKGTDNSSIVIFEGFMDFLSSLVYFGSDHYNDDVIVLNSLVFAPRIIEYLFGYDSVTLFFDNDAAGDDKTDYVIDRLRDANVECKDAREIYNGFNDFNEFLIYG